MGKEAVAMVSRPAARLIDARRTLEVRRLCVRRDLPRPLTLNACSLLYGWCGREARRRGFESLITYTLLDEPGSTLRASGWTPERVTAGGTWNRASRPRVDKAPITPKVRWRRMLRPAGPLPIAA